MQTISRIAVCCVFVVVECEGVDFFACLAAQTQKEIFPTRISRASTKKRDGKNAAKEKKENRAKRKRKQKKLCDALRSHLSTRERSIDCSAKLMRRENATRRTCSRARLEASAARGSLAPPPASS
jgi:hypothetical protein